MNGKRTFGEVMPDEKLSAFLNALCNKWFKKWRAEELTEDRFMQAWAELDDVIHQGEQYPFVRHLYIAFLYELDARRFGGYTETTRDKLLTLIKGETYGT